MGSSGDRSPASSAAVEVLRLLDAAANRASEGLRVVEDFVRFALDDRHLTRQCKQLRHRLDEATGGLLLADRYACRDVMSDVGTEVVLESEQRRTDAWQVCRAGFKRVEQALRSLEEFAKTINGARAADFERLRYDVYALERAVGTTALSAARLANVRLIVLVGAGQSPEEFFDKVQRLVAAGVHAIQLRDKRLGDRALAKHARLLCRATRGTATLALINDRADMARIAQADGVQLGQTDLSVRDARRVMGSHGLVGVSTHSLDEARQAVAAGADLIGVGPVFPSVTKTFASYCGVGLLRRVSEQVRLPAFAIGGINLDNASDALASGVHGLAVGAAIDQHPQPQVVAGQLLQIMREHQGCAHA